MEVNKLMLERTHYEIVKVIDGDGIIVKNIFTNKEEEIRLLGIDAPEIKKCNKLMQDERETHIAGQFLIELGYKSFAFLRKKAKPQTNITIIQEIKNQQDRFGRTLAYIILPNGKTLNEIMVRKGYAKPYIKTYCNELPLYQKLNLKAKKKKKGLYLLSSNF